MGANHGCLPPAETPLPGGPLGVILRSTYLRLAGGYRPCCCTKPFGFLLGNAGTAALGGLQHLASVAASRPAAAAAAGHRHSVTPRAHVQLWVGHA